MKFLIIGGTRFLGRHLVNSIRARRHEVTLFNRGLSNPGLFPRVKKIRGDRDKDLDQLKGQNWDAVIDTCGYFPRSVRMSAEALKGAVDKYVFVSTLSVYDDLNRIGINESHPVGVLQDETVEEVTDETYGPLKALCEQVVQDVFKLSSLIIRPGLIAGPHDPTDRFTYWPVRVSRGGDVLAPDRPEAPIQFIDVRDAADFMIELIQQDTSGVFNVTGPQDRLTLGTLLETCKMVSGSDANFKWAPLDFLRENNVSPWSDMPAWLPDEGENTGFASMDVSKAVHAGLKFTPLNDTIRDTLEWARTRPADHHWLAGLTPEREKELLGLLGNVR